MDPITSIAIQLGITFGLKALQWWLAEPAPPKQPKRFSQEPTTHEGDSLPVTYGRCRLTRPLLAWHGWEIHDRDVNDFYTSGTSNIDERVFGVNLLFNLGLSPGPMQANTGARLLALYFGDAKYETNLADTEYVIFTPISPLPPPPTPFVYWADANMGTIYGRMQFYAGTSVQVISSNNPLSPPDWDDITEIGAHMRRDYRDFGSPNPTTIPAYRGQMLVGFCGDHQLQGLTHFYFGNGESLPAISFEVATDYHLYGTIRANGDMNPVDVISDILFNPVGRLGINSALVDPTSFSAVAALLESEDHGFSYSFDSETNGHDALKMVIDQAGLSLFFDPISNNIKLAAIRDDYNPSTIPHFGVDHVDKDQSIEFTAGSQQNLTNQVEIIYTDRRQNYEQASVVRQNQASAVAQSSSATDSRMRTTVIEYPGCTSRDLALRLADRDLSYLSQPLATLKVTLNRLVDLTGNYSAADLRPGSVFKLTFPDYYIDGVVFRVERVDPGQLGDNAITVEATQDPFWLAAPSEDETDDGGVGYIPVPTPINHRHVEEAPRWMLAQAANRGLIDSADKQRIWTHATPDDAASSFRGHSAAATVFASDVHEASFTPSFTLQTLMTREAEPYDSTTTYTFDFGSDQAFFVAGLDTTWDPDDIRNDGMTLFVIDDEIMGYEVLDSIGSGAAHVTKIWRGLLDTPATEHAVGSRGWLVGNSVNGLAYIGRRAWPQLAGVGVKLLARLGLSIGSGGDPSDTIDFRLRTMRQYPVQNLAIAGETITGTQGMPTQAATAPALGYFKSATVLEEDISHIAYKTRDRNQTTILRGDDASEDPTDVIVGGGITWQLAAQKGDAAEVTLLTGISNDGNSGARLHALLGPAGHGDIDVIMHTVKSTPAGKYGIPPATSVVDEWDAPRVRVNAPRWRNLLANPRFSYDFDDSVAAGDGLGEWIAVSGTPLRVQGTTSPTRSATGWYVTGTPAGGTCSFRQTVNVSGYKPRGMRCTFWAHVRNLNADAGDTIAIDVIALNAAGATLATQSLAPYAAPTATWQKLSIVHSSLPADTVSIRVLVTLAGVGDTSPDSAIAETSLFLGDYLDDVLTNPSFDSSGTGWTNIVNSFAYPTTLPFANRNGTASNYGQGGAFASSEISRDYTVPTGREFGTFVLRLWRMNEGNNDTGNVIVEARNGGGVLASTSTGLEFMTSQNVWFRRRLSLDLPDGTTTVRVRLIANRAGGAGNSGASFDELHAQIVNDLDSSYERELLLSSPTVQQMPTTWQQWHTTYVQMVDDGIQAPLVLGPSTFGSGSTYTSSPPRLRWSDNVARAADAFVGQWGGGRGSINGTRFTRQSGAGALDVQSHLEAVGWRICGPTSAESFTAVVWFRVDEASFSTACGIVGRCDGVSGWELTINASGELQAVLRGDAGNAVATRTGVSVIDGAVHMAAIIYDAGAQTLTVLDELGNNSVSTAAIGDFANTNPATVLRIGRSRSTIDTIPGVIGPVYYWRQALSAGQCVGDSDALWQYALDPTAAGLTTNRSVPHFVDGPANAAGCTLALLSEEQLAFGYYDVLSDPGDEYVGESMGLALCRGTTNLIPSWNFAGASWVVDGGVSLVQSIVDPTGRKTGVTLVDINVGVGFKVIGLSMTATTTLTVVFYARAETGTPNIDVQLMNASDVVKQTITIPLSTQWQRLTASFTAWDNSTPTARIRWKANAAKINIDLGGVVYACQGTEVPTMFNVVAAGAMADVYASLAETLPLEFNAHGEIIAEGTSRLSTPAANGSVVGVDNGSNNNNARELLAQSTTPRLSHYDATTPTNVTSTGSAIDWNQFWQLRGRWSATQTLDSAVTPFAGLVVDADVDSATYGRTATFSYSAVANDDIKLGKGASGNAPLSCYLRRVVIRAREEKLA